MPPRMWFPLKKKLLIVGAFTDADKQIVGGILTTCRELLNSTFPDHFDLVLVDSTQASNPPPSLPVRAYLALKRFVVYFSRLFFARPDAVLLFSAVGFSLLDKGAMAWMARIRRIPVLLSPRGAGLIQTVEASFVHRTWVKAAMRGATHIVCQGPAWQRFAVDTLGFTVARCPIIQNWTATRALMAIGEKRTKRDASRTPRLLFLGWLEKEKGIFELLNACLALAKDHDFHVTVAGGGHAEEPAKAFVQANGLEGFVDFAGWVGGEHKEQLLADTDILVLPSWEEGFPNAIIEAMAAKLAVIVTAVGNVPDLLTDGKEALIVPRKDEEVLGGAIGKLLHDEAFREQLAEQGHIFARDNFSVGPNVSKLIAVIDAAIVEKSA